MSRQKSPRGKKSTAWTARIKDLKDAGLRLTEIAELTAIPLSTVSDLASGRSQTATYENGKKIDELHQSRCGAPAQPAPAQVA